MTRSPGRGWVGAGVGLAAGLLALGPALGPGFLLHYDMVFVPRLGFSERTLGIDGSVPRAVPNDLLVAVLSEVAPGWIVQKALVLGAFVLVGAGIAGFARTRVGAGAAALAAAWNPWVAERLAIGHWGFVLGYAVLPWVARAAAAMRTGRPGGRRALVAAVVGVALTGSTASILALLLAGAVLLCAPTAEGGGDPSRASGAWGARGGGRGGGRGAGLQGVLLLVGVWVLANAAWWWPFLRLAPTGAADAAGVAAFAARADTPLGVLGSLVTGGGIWNAGTWFGERATWPGALAALTAVVLVLGHAVVARQWREHPALPGLLLAGVLGLLLAALSALPGGSDLVARVVTGLPGGGLVRDSQKFAALWVLVVAVAAGGAAATVARRVRAWGGSRIAAAGFAGMLALWPVVTLPGLAWGALGRWSAVAHPADHLRIAAEIEAAEPGAVAVFPWALYRRYAWNGNRVTLDPWQRLLTRRVLVNDDLPLSDRVVRGESADAAAVREVVSRGVDVAPLLRSLGVRYAVLLTDQPSGGLPATVLRGASVRWQGSGVSVLDLGPGAATGQPVAGAGGGRRLGLAGLGVAVLGALAALGSLLVGRVWRRRRE